MDESSGISLSWSVQSEDCARLISSVDIVIYNDGSETPWRSYKVPATCFAKSNSSSFTIDNTDSCNSDITGMPLQYCRNYKLEMWPRYDSNWNGQSLAVEYFAAGGAVPADNTGNGNCIAYISNEQVQSIIEAFFAVEPRCCYLLKSSLGSFQSVNYDGKFDCNWLISVEPNSVIWLTFSQFQVENYYYHVKVRLKN